MLLASQRYDACVLDVGRLWDIINSAKTSKLPKATIDETLHVSRLSVTQS
jgi:hypothetical protein